MGQKKWTNNAGQLLREANKAAKEMNCDYIGTEHLLLAALAVKESVPSFLLTKYEITKASLKEAIEQFAGIPSEPVSDRERTFTPQAKECLAEAERLSDYYRHSEIGTEHIMMALIKDRETVAARLLVTMNIDLQRMFAELVEAMGEDPSSVRDFFRKEGGERADTSLLDRFSRDLTLAAGEGRLDPLIGRQEEIGRVIQTLSRRLKNNPCIVGEPGVGKTAIVEGLASAIVEERVPDCLLGKRVVMLDLAAMVAGTKYRGEFEERFHNVLDEIMQAGNILLFIDEIHTIIGSGNAEGSMDAAHILKPLLARGELQVIGATTLNEYRKYLEKDAALERRFQSVLVEEPDEEQTVQILWGLRPRYEEHHEIAISDEALEACAALSARYVSDRCLPDKAIDLMDEAAAKVRMRKPEKSDKRAELEEAIALLEDKKREALSAGDANELFSLREQQEELKQKLEKMKKREHARKKATMVERDDVAEVVAEWTGVPVQQMKEKESERLLKLEQTLHRRVIGQEKAVEAVSRAVRRGRIGMKDPKRPIGSFLFLGPTGVGKTELSKALAEAVFGDEKAMIRVDMSEFMEKHSVSKLIGSPPGYIGFEDGSPFSEKIRKHPYSLILFDEIEKAHPDVFNVLLQVLDDGHITDSQGRKVDFKNTIIIMTSNAGASRILEPKQLGFGAAASEEQDYERMKNSVMEEIRRIFRPEFLNRIDDILVFHALGKAEMKQVAGNMIDEIRKRLMETVGAQLVITPAAKELFVEEGYDKKYGARPLKRELQTKLEDKLADLVLSGEVSRGDVVTVSVENKKLKYTSKKSETMVS